MAHGGNDPAPLYSVTEACVEEASQRESEVWIRGKPALRSIEVCEDDIVSVRKADGVNEMHSPLVRHWPMRRKDATI